MKKLALSLAKKMGYVVALFLILAAIIVGASRFLSPIVDKHRSDFEKIASSMLDAPVSIEKVHFSWYQYQPTIGFNEVTILNKETNKPALQIRDVKLFFSIPRSIWRRSLVPSGIMISGSELNVHQSETGEFSVQGFPSLGGFNSQPYSNETKFKDVMKWLSEQPRLILQNIDVSLTSKIGEKHLITLHNLSFENSGDVHNIQGKAVLHQKIPTEATLAIEWQGKEFDLEQIKAKLYLYVTGVSLSQWKNSLVWDNWRIDDGVVSAKVWATWGQGVFHKIQASLQTFGLSIYSTTSQSSYRINRLSGNAGWKREGKGYIIAGDDILIDLPTHLWPVTNFYLALKPDAKGELSPTVATLGYVDLHDIQSILPSFPTWLTESSKKMLNDLQLKGSLQNATITFANPWTDWNQTAINANVMQLSFLPWNNLPGVKNVSGAIKWNGAEGSVTLNTNRAQLTYDAFFTKPIQIDQLTGVLQAKRNQNNEWLLTSPGIQLLNNDLAANVGGSLTLPADKSSPIADMKANLTMQKINAVTRYLPSKIMDKELTEWLKQAFLGGDIKSATAILRGKLTDFPFDNKDGEFSVSTVVKNVDFSYAPGWPLMKRLNANLVFAGRKMTIDVDSAFMFSIPLKNVHGVIPYLGGDKPQILDVQSDAIPMDFAEGLHFVHASPLEKNIGKMFADMDVSGPTTLTLNLTVPLSHPDDTQVKGSLALKDTKIKLVPWNLTVDKLNGELGFTEKGTTAQNIQGLLFNKPLTFSLATLPKTKTTSIVQAKFTNTIDLADLEKWLKIPLSTYAEGTTEVSGEIDMGLDSPLELRLKSNLVGVTIKDLPDDYGKKAEEARAFSANIFSQEKQPLRLQLEYGQLLGAALILDRKEKGEIHLISAGIQLGAGVPPWPATPGLYITGDFAQLEWDQIKKYMGDKAVSNNTTQMNMGGLKLKGIDINAKRLKLGSQIVDDISFQVEPTANSWNVNISSPDIVGQLQVPANFNRQGQITAQFQRINLKANESATASSLPDFEVKSLPAISFVANSITYNGMPLGQVSFKTVPNNQGMVIKSLSIMSSRVNLQASGDWQQTGNNYVTHLRGRANSSNVTALLSSLGFDAKNFIANKGALDFDLNWGNAPYAPSLASLTGRAKLDLGSGRVVDIGQESGAKMDIGRMLSIFSLQTIPRRLSLDFSDVFQKGYSFDFIRGDFNFENGDAYTNNLRFEGPVAKVAINGRIGLKNKDYNFILSITPYVTSSVPVAAGLMVATGLLNPLVGLGAFAVNGVIGPQVSKVSTYYYSVTGPWDNPSWKSSSSAAR